MKKNLWPLMVVLGTVVGVQSLQYVKTANERGRLFFQLQEAAEVVSANSPDSPQARAAMERGMMIAAGWPCHWWEDHRAVRSKTAEVFENLIALKRENNAQADSQPARAKQ